jgi:hypothetical protein
MSEAELTDYLLRKEPGVLPPLARAETYRRLVRSNLSTVLTNAFPDVREQFGEARFQELCGQFLEEGGPSTPFYRDIPGDLVLWAGTREHPLASALQEEWLEIVAARHPAELDTLEPIPRPLIRPNPTMQIGVFTRDEGEGPLAHLFWRRPKNDETELHRTGLLLARALAYAAEEPASAEVLADRLAAETPQLTREAIFDALSALEKELREREGIL